MSFISRMKSRSLPYRVRSVFATMEELNYMWGFAEDLESYEYVCKEFLNYFCGPVCLMPLVPLHKLF